MRKAIFVLIITSGSLMCAARNGAMLIGSGNVQVNGAQAAKSFTVFPGDRVQTAANSSALIKTPGALVSIASDSAIQYQDNSVTFEHGNVVVSAPKGMNASFGKLVISADPSHSAKFQLTSANGVETIAALDGSLNITDGTHSTKLNAGHMMTRAPMNASASGPDPTGRAGLAGWVTAAIVVGAVGGLIGGLAAAGAFDGPSSPSHP
jgi:hypothetical protein